MLLSCLGCYNRTINWVAYKQQKFFLTLLEAEKSKIKVPAGLECDEASLLVLRRRSSRYVLAWQKRQRALWDLFHEGNNLICISSMLMTHFPKAPPLNSITLGLRISHLNFGGTHIQSIVVSLAGEKKKKNNSIHFVVRLVLLSKLYLTLVSFGVSFCFSFKSGFVFLCSGLFCT